MALFNSDTRFEACDLKTTFKHQFWIKDRSYEGALILELYRESKNPGYLKVSDRNSLNLRIIEVAQSSVSMRQRLVRCLSSNNEKFSHQVAETILVSLFVESDRSNDQATTQLLLRNLNPTTDPPLIESDISKYAVVAFLAALKKKIGNEWQPTDSSKEALRTFASELSQSLPILATQAHKNTVSSFYSSSDLSGIHQFFNFN